ARPSLHSTSRRPRRRPGGRPWGRGDRGAALRARCTRPARGARGGLGAESYDPAPESMDGVPESRRGTRHEPPVYEQPGGVETVCVRVRRFYPRGAEDPLRRPRCAEAELGPAEGRLRLLLMEYWGGSRTYCDTRGHPRLRMRHVPCKGDRGAHDAWVKHM